MTYKPRTLDAVIAALPLRKQRAIAARTEELLAEEASLQALRKALGKTQVALAKRLKIGQHAVSRIETRGDMHVSTLRGFIEAMGGELELVATFPDRPPVLLKRLGKGPARRKQPRPTPG